MTLDYDLPEGWRVKPLAAAAQLVKEKVEPELVPNAFYIGLEHVEAHTMKLLGHGVGSDVKSAKSRFRSGDVLYGKLRPYLNKVVCPDFDGICSTDFLVFTESEDLTPEFLAQFLNQLSVANYAHHVSTGVELPRVDWKSLGAVQIAFPVSKSGQQAIVGQIIDARRLVTLAEDHLGHASECVVRFRQAVLAAACSGRLSAEWRSAHPQARAWDEYGLARRTTKLRRGVDPSQPCRSFDVELPQSWATFTVAQLLAQGALEDVKDGNHGANHPKVSEFTAEGLPFIAANLVRNSRIDYEQAPRVSGDALARLRVGFSHPGDVILTHKGSVGRVAVATQDAVLTPQTTYYRCAYPVLPEYLALFFESFLFYEQLVEVMSQTTRDFVPITQQYQLAIIIPPYDEQIEIVRRVGSLLDLAGSVLESIGSAAKDVERSSQAILARAFRGGLQPGLSEA